MPATSNAIASAGVEFESPASTSPPPIATSTASRRLARWPGVAGAPSSRRAGTASVAASAANGSSATNTTRQPNAVAMNAAAAGPTIAGRTHAVEMIANIRGR